MKINKHIILPGLLLLGSLAAFGTALSYAGDDEACAGPHGKHAHAGGPGAEDAGFHRGLRGLDLTGDQKAQIKQIMDKQKPVREQKMQALHDGMQNLQTLAKAEPYDPAKVQAAAAEQAKIQADLIVLRTDAAHQVYALLTPEQKQKWNDRPERGPKKPDDRG
ncbi:Spy/CpxP family protein refolding chaperone [Methylovorus glucosotrophus]|uniref:Spy/CpxP family protein refolding chaperone n=1 Tax=Methylovorus glucosotrophus TaxID=266009 RepID=UPI0013316D01|nr:Spy/CpxP family protein refolding chaperone [Methylovorus glucosotrophus]KAF0844199.1 Spy/CpxP family protein refolding chaperone [Methylovorus glucosotrophus]